VHQESRGLTYSNNEAVLVANEGARFELPPGTPFGQAGDPLWILPQSPYPGVLYLGLSSEQVPLGVIQGPLAITLIGIDLPGRLPDSQGADFYAWQAGQVGDLQLAMSSADGITETDRITMAAGAHSHYNWGFSTPGLWHVTFESTGRLAGQSTNIASGPVTLAFHVLPLSGFERWQSTNWPPATPRSVIGPEADPDDDGVPNLLEYAFGLNPSVPDRGGTPRASVVMFNGQAHGAVTYRRNKTAADLVYQVRSASSINAAVWEVLSDIHMVSDDGGFELVTVRDAAPVSSHRARFYKLAVSFR
jgi:surface-anchored protein